MSALLITGCQQNKTNLTAVTAGTVPIPVLDLSAKAGVKVEPKAASVDPRQLIATKSFSSRPDAFSLMSEEQKFDEFQESERVLSGTGWQVTVPITLEMNEERPVVVEAVPYWRLSGVIVGNGVIALLDTGGGKVYDVRPGSKVPGTEWRVVSIDGERALLARDSNKLPKQFEVGLQGPIGGVLGGPPRTPAGGGGNPQGAPAGGGAPGNKGGGMVG